MHTEWECLKDFDSIFKTETKFFPNWGPYRSKFFSLIEAPGLDWRQYFQDGLFSLSCLPILKSNSRKEIHQTNKTLIAKLSHRLVKPFSLFSQNHLKPKQIMTVQQARGLWWSCTNPLTPNHTVNYLKLHKSAVTSVKGLLWGSCLSIKGNWYTCKGANHVKNVLTFLVNRDLFYKEKNSSQGAISFLVGQTPNMGMLSVLKRKHEITKVVLPTKMVENLQCVSISLTQCKKFYTKSQQHEK